MGAGTVGFRHLRGVREACGVREHVAKRARDGEARPTRRRAVVEARWQLDAVVPPVKGVVRGGKGQRESGEGAVKRIVERVARGSKRLARGG